MSDNTTTRCGFVTIIGAPNAGKSTLTNALLGAKVSIVSPKVQTTRSRVRGIMMRGPSQVILVDTPGIFAPKRTLDRAMVRAAWDGAQEGDITAIIIDARRKGAAAEGAELIAALRERRGDGADGPCILILNKIDGMKRDLLLPLTAALNAAFPFDATFMISALKADGTDDLADWLAAHVPEGAHLYPPDQLSDMSERLLAAEITREKLFLQLHEELPYGLSVETEKWEDFDNGDVRIAQIIYVAREAHKPMVLGKGGARIRAVGQAARTELEEMLGRKVHLNLFVKVDPDWMNDPHHLGLLGLEIQ